MHQNPKAPTNNLLLVNIGELVSLAPLASSRRTTQIKDSDLGRLAGPSWLAIKEGKVVGLGQGEPDQAWRDLPQLDANRALVIPGLVDSHAHPIFAGSRAHEFVQRLNGVSYQDIAAAGGGIASSMKATRNASATEHRTLLVKRLARFLELGITTLEAKSGYGLSVDDELALLRILNGLKQELAQQGHGQHLSITCLALHAKSPEYASLRAYSEACTHELLPAVAREGLADAADAFIEEGYFSIADTEPYALKAKDLGLKLRLHADEFSDAGGAKAAAQWGANSADHLQYASDEGVKAMAAAGVTATILPGTSLYTKIPFANARRFADAGCAVAVASDFNPGSCVIDNLAMLASLSAIHNGLRPAEAIAAVTYVPAVSLDLASQKGALTLGFDADFLLYEMDSIETWLADFGRTRPQQVWIKGGRRL